MIKGIILDIDGVIVGEKIGYNSPYPHPDVIARLKSIEAKGIPVSLCTAKPYYAIRKIIDDANLHNLHITEGGAVIIDPIDNSVLKSHAIDKAVAKLVVQSYIDAGVYVEVYALNNYMIDKSQQSELTRTHTHILQQDPQIVESLADAMDKQAVFKIMPIAVDENDKTRLEAVFKPYENELTLSWGVHRIALPHQFGIITNKGISKHQAVLEISDHSDLDPADMLGIGDSTSDWQFIEPCGYAATLENATAELKQLVKTKGDKACIGGHVDKNGVLAIFDYFGL